MSDAASTQPVVTVLTARGAELPPGLEPLRGEARLRHADSTESLAQALPGTEVLCVTDFRTSALRDAWHEADRLTWIHATSAGVDRLLFDAMRASDVTVTNARGIFDGPIAEFVLGRIIAFCKDFLGSLDAQQRHQWRHRETERVAGRSVLVVGAGGIGREIARLCRAVGLQVDGVARKARSGNADFGEIHGQESLQALLPHYDYVVVAAPLTADTEGLFDEAAFRAMRSDARFINIGRGRIVRTEALTKALREGWIAGAALDVFEQEPLPAEHPLWDTPNVMLSAHMAGDVVGWEQALSEQFIANFRRWRSGEPLFNLVDKQRGYVPSG
jgi:phosphoglycerate dehydrogenase-like enzyme